MEETTLTWNGEKRARVRDGLYLEAVLQRGDTQTVLLYVHGDAGNVCLRTEGTNKISLPLWSDVRRQRYFIVDLTATTRVRTLLLDGVETCRLVPGFNLKNCL